MIHKNITDFETYELLKLKQNIKQESHTMIYRGVVGAVYFIIPQAIHLFQIQKFIVSKLLNSHFWKVSTFCFSMVWQTLVGQGFLIVDASRSHSDAPHSVGFLWSARRQDHCLITQHSHFTSRHGAAHRKTAVRISITTRDLYIYNISYTMHTLLKAVPFFNKRPECDLNFMNITRYSWTL